MSVVMKRDLGFTLIEMMVVVSVLSLLAMLAWPVAELANTRQKERELRQALWQIREAIDAYKTAVDQGAIASPNLSGYPPSLAVLVDGALDLKSGNPRRYFLRRLPRDPFASPSDSDEASWGLRSYASTAENPTPGADVYDVYSKSDRIGTNAVPLRRW
jgi:general secretion pathway protein G